MTPEDEVVALRRPFLVGLLACFAGLLCVGGIVAAFGANADRPEGVAERWLTAVADLTREGVAGDAAHRAAELELPGVGAAAALVATFPPEAIEALDGDPLFETIQVGRADRPDGEAVAGARLAVPVEVTVQEGDPSRARVDLQLTDDGWRVGGLTPVDPAAATPGFPLERPERAPIGFWIGAIALGAVIAAACSFAVRAATPRPA